MAKDEYSEYQKAAAHSRLNITAYKAADYYANLDTIMLDKLGNLVSELYLAESQAKQDRLWQKALKAMEKLNIPPAIIEHIMEKRDVEILAKNLQDWLNHSRKK